jgi:polysaccharide export outer membrane protein
MDTTKKPIALYPQPISGQHLVRPDGTVNLGIWGPLMLTGLTCEQAAEAVRQHVFRKIKSDPHAKDRPPVSSTDQLFVTVDVMAYNSKVYYLIADGAGYGEQIFPFPCTGNETVLDALSKINGLPELGSKNNIWVARRAPGHGNPEQVLPVDYIGITQKGIVATNYQVFPGDRIYVRAQAIFKIDRFLQKVLTPVERILGVTLLGSSTVNSIKTGGTGSVP